MLRFEIRQLLLRVDQLTLSRRSLILSHRGFGLRVLCLALTCLQQDTIAILLRTGDLLTGACLGDAGLARLRVAHSQVGQLVDLLRRVLLLKCGVRLVQAGPCRIHVPARRLLCQRIG